jgi:predicted TIM-barrel fold metal-dependent hydrolase
MDFEYYWITEPIYGVVYGVKEVLADADAGGIDHVVLIPGNNVNPDNKGLAEAVKGQPRLIGCCQINPTFGQAAVDELETAITRWGMRSLKLMPMSCNYDIASRTPRAVLDKAYELKIPVNIHSSPWPGCRPWEIAAVAARYPKMPIIMDHMGYRDCVSQAWEVAKTYPNIYLACNTVAEPLTIKEAVLQVGADRIVFGSNGPGVFVDLAVEAILRLKLGREAEEAILGGNLARVYGIA